MKSLLDLVSHRVLFEYDEGVAVVGYVSSVRPANGPVYAISLSNVSIYKNNELLESHREITLIPHSMIRYSIHEGPSAQKK